jgi:hypothetical protein
MLTSAQRAVYIAHIRQLPAHVAAQVCALTPEQLITPYLKGEWSVAQNVHHLADSHLNSYIRCKLAATEDQPTIRPYDQDAWAELPDARNANVAHSLTLLTALHARWAEFFETLPAEAWSRTLIHPVSGVHSLDDMLQTYAKHGLDHLEQMQRTLAARTAS